jgi:hypothetical protein
MVMTLSCLVAAQGPSPAPIGTSPEMNRLAKMFVGDWDTVETMERSDFFPNGGGRHGVNHWKLSAGGTTLIGEGHSNGSAGELSYVIAIWWDKQESVYRFFTCFNDAGAPCKIRGTAHWDRNSLINEYEEVVKGEKKEFQDIFTQNSPNSRTLVAAIKTADGNMKPLITTKSTRR